MAQIKTPDLGGINNTIEAVLYCKEHGMGAYLGGTCNETNRSAEVCANIAMATKPVQYLAKPGMGVDERLYDCVQRNEPHLSTHCRIETLLYIRKFNIIR